VIGEPVLMPLAFSSAGKADIRLRPESQETCRREATLIDEGGSPRGRI